MEVGRVLNETNHLFREISNYKVPANAEIINYHLTCDRCDSRIWTYTEMDQHVAWIGCLPIRLEDWIYFCYNCSSKFKDKNSFEKHVKMHLHHNLFDNKNCNAENSCNVCKIKVQLSE